MPQCELGPLQTKLDTVALFARPLTLLQAVQLVPALPTRLLPMLVQNMPHKLRDRSAQCLYLGALISLCEGKVGPALREGLLGGLVEHLLSIDADIRWEDIVDAPTGEARVVCARARLQLVPVGSIHLRDALLCERCC
jgi:RNA polymerase I-specific transcription initiation factor RRN3